MVHYYRRTASFGVYAVSYFVGCVKGGRAAFVCFSSAFSFVVLHVCYLQIYVQLCIDVVKNASSFHVSLLYDGTGFLWAKVYR